MLKDSMAGFGPIRSFFWPIYRYELKKLLPLLAIAFFITFNYHMLRTMKDSLLVTAAGAEVIPFVKVWAMLPMAVLCVSIFIKLSHRFAPERVLYIMMGSFMAFYALFIFVLYPCREWIHPHGFALWLEGHLPIGAQGMIRMIEYWSFSLFYSMSELWGAIILMVCFWGFANEITKVHEATRFYALIGLGANVSGIFAGNWGYRLSLWNYHPGLYGEDRWHQTLILLTLSVMVSGMIALALFRWYNTHVLKGSMRSKVDLKKQADKVTNRGSMRSSIRYLSKSKYLTCIAILVIGYNVVINLTEVLFKHQVRLAYPAGNDYEGFMCRVTIWIAVVAIFGSWLACGNVVRRWGWTVAALVAPAAFIGTGILFFFAYFAPAERLDAVASLFGIGAVPFLALLAAGQNVLCRACKFSLFDETKEMAFIPIDREMRVKGKATIDGVGSRFGKSGGSLIYQGLLLMFRTLEASASCVALIMVAVLAGWTWAIRSLGQQFHGLTQGAERKLREEDVVPAAEEPAPAKA